MKTTPIDLEQLRLRAVKLRLSGLLSHWDELCTQPWVAELVELEATERDRRSHQYRIKNAEIGACKPMVDFDWKHPRKIDRHQVQSLFDLGFIEDHDNIVIVGPNGIGKTMTAQNLAFEAVTADRNLRKGIRGRVKVVQSPA